MDATPIDTRRYAHLTLEGHAQQGSIGEAALLCDLDQPGLGGAQQAHRHLDAGTADFLLHGAVEHAAEAALELHEAIIRNEAGWQRRAFEAFHGLVHGLLIKSLGPRAEIADLVGDAFVIFFGSAHRIQSALAVRSYLVSITMNLARREVRQRKRRELFQRFTGGAPEYEQEPGPDDPKAKAALIQLSRILDELPADDRSAFVLSNLEGMPALEVAELLGVSESTAKRRIRRANERVLKRVRCNVLLADYVQARTERGHG